MSRYIYQIHEWPSFIWQAEKLLEPLSAMRHRQGRFLGRMESLGFELRAEAELQALTSEILKSNEIEGELLQAESVRSSLARRLGVATAGMAPADRHVEGAVDMMLDATANCEALLTEERLFGWHAALFPTGRSGMYRITAGNWRDDRNGPMQVVSGPLGKGKVHFQAPDAAFLAAEMKCFFLWFNSEMAIDPVLKAGIAHLWFVTLHPFDDGNGRMARAIADLQLARAEKSPQRFYSMSAQIQRERKTYYELLEKTQKGTLDVTAWLLWFVACLDRAVAASEELLATVLQQAVFFRRFSNTPLNERQRLMLNKLFQGFEGKLTTTKWAKMTKCSQDTALRDIQDLMEKGMLEKEEGGGRSTGYRLAELKEN